MHSEYRHLLGEQGNRAAGRWRRMLDWGCRLVGRVHYREMKGSLLNVFIFTVK